MSIVVGRKGSGYVTRALLGSTSENVLRHAPCDVLVVV
jgi:nucleotide-binding universal stress UspA family protein